MARRDILLTRWSVVLTYQSLCPIDNVISGVDKSAGPINGKFAQSGMTWQQLSGRKKEASNKDANLPLFIDKQTAAVKFE